MSVYETRQRRVLLAWLEAHPDELLSVRQIADGLAEEKVSLSAVYRNLASLEAEGKVRRQSAGAGRESFYRYVDADACRGALHLRCKKCGRTCHMEKENARHLVEALAASEGFELDKADTVLYGVCEDCRK